MKYQNTEAEFSHIDHIYFNVAAWAAQIAYYCGMCMDELRSFSFLEMTWNPGNIAIFVNDHNVGFRIPFDLINFGVYTYTDLGGARGCWQVEKLIQSILPGIIQTTGYRECDSKTCAHKGKICICHLIGNTFLCDDCIQRKKRNKLPESKDVVYFLQGETTKNIKIGLSNDIEKRIKSIKTACSEKLLLLGWINGGGKTEKSLHKKFRRLRLHGEWFRGDRILTDFIKNHPKLQTIPENSF